MTREDWEMVVFIGAFMGAGSVWWVLFAMWCERSANRIGRKGP